jgi:hypothetical protein
MAAPNPFAVDALVEVFKAGDLGKGDAQPAFSEKAHPDGTPVHAGLGASGKFDLRVTFPTKGAKPVEAKGLDAGKKSKAFSWACRPAKKSINKNSPASKTSLKKSLAAVS